MSSFWIERLEAKKQHLLALEAALLEFAQDGGKQTVSLDTGQTRVSYTRSDISTIRRTISALENDIAVLEVRIGCGKGHFYGRPLY